MFGDGEVAAVSYLADLINAGAGRRGGEGPSLNRLRAAGSFSNFDLVLSDQITAPREIDLSTKPSVTY